MKKVWHGLYELAEARDDAKQLLLALEALLKEHRSMGKSEIKNHSDKLLADAEETLQTAREKTRNILAGLEMHKKRIVFSQRFIRRHYGRESK